MAIASVQVGSWQAAYRGLMPDEVLDGLSVERRAEVWRSVAAGRAGEAVLVLEGNDGIEGFAHVCAGRDVDIDAGTGEVSSIYLLPASWGKGRGRALMDAAVQRLCRGGLPLGHLVGAGHERPRPPLLRGGGMVS